MDKDLEYAIGRMASIFDKMNGDSGTVFTGFTCDEADGLALVWALAGHLGAAASVIAMHAVGDADGEDHGAIGDECERQSRLGVSPVDGRSIVLARAYVEGLVTGMRCSR